MSCSTPAVERQRKQAGWSDCGRGRSYPFVRWKREVDGCHRQILVPTSTIIIIIKVWHKDFNLYSKGLILQLFFCFSSIVKLCHLRVMSAGGSTSSHTTHPRSVFHRALEAANLSWECAHLQTILRGCGGGGTIPGTTDRYCSCSCRTKSSSSNSSKGCSIRDANGQLIWQGIF